MKYTKLFFTTVSPENIKMDICAEYNKNTTGKKLLFTTFSRWVRHRSDHITKKAVLDAVTRVTGLKENQILDKS